MKISSIDEGGKGLAKQENLTGLDVHFKYCSQINSMDEVGKNLATPQTSPSCSRAQASRSDQLQG